MLLKSRSNQLWIGNLQVNYFFVLFKKNQTPKFTKIKFIQSLVIKFQYLLKNLFSQFITWLEFRKWPLIKIQNH